MDINEEIAELGASAKSEARELRSIKGRRRSAILQDVADALEERTDEILAANQRDVQAFGRDAPLMGLAISDGQLKQAIREIRTIADLKDPIGLQVSRWIRPNGIKIVKERVPLGVVAVLFDTHALLMLRAFAMCLKTANALIFYGRAESSRTTEALHACLTDVCSAKRVPVEAFPRIKHTSDAAAEALVQLKGVVDVIIPLCSQALEQRICSFARVPVIEQSSCGTHIYIDESADLKMAGEIVANDCWGEWGRHGATLLVHTSMAEALLPGLAADFSACDVPIRGHASTKQLLPGLEDATDLDWFSAGANGAICVRLVQSVDEAINHIICYGNGDAECIITGKEANRNLFVRSVDAPCVYANASSAFTSGAEFGMGPEIAVSTGKLHARGPMGLEELTTYHYVIQGSGQVRE